MTYRYYDSPEGKDCVFKTWYLTKLGTLAGSGVAIIDVLFLSHPQGPVALVGRLGYVASPFVLSAATFGAITCISNQIRKKDDVANYIIGGACAGAVFGAKFKSMAIASVCAGAFAAAGAVKKLAVQENYTFLPKAIQDQGDLYSATRDYTGNFVKDVPRYKD